MVNGDRLITRTGVRAVHKVANEPWESQQRSGRLLEAFISPGEDPVLAKRVITEPCPMLAHA